MEAALARAAITQTLAADTETVVLPQAERAVEVHRVHPLLPFSGGPAVTYAGIPSKRLVTVPGLADQVPAELAVAALAEPVLGGPAWWSVWGSLTHRISPVSRTKRALPGWIVDAIGVAARRAADLMVVCDRRSTETGRPWRRDRATTGGGLWDVIATTADRGLVFVERKQAGTADRLRDNQRAFLECLMPRLGLEAWTIVSWHSAGH